jgi:hypothetical protein
LHVYIQSSRTVGMIAIWRERGQAIENVERFYRRPQGMSSRQAARDPVLTGQVSQCASGFLQMGSFVPFRNRAGPGPFHIPRKDQGCPKPFGVTITGAKAVAKSRWTCWPLLAPNRPSRPPLATGRPAAATWFFESESTMRRSSAIRRRASTASPRATGAPPDDPQLK